MPRQNFLCGPRPARPTSRPLNWSPNWPNGQSFCYGRMSMLLFDVCNLVRTSVRTSVRCSIVLFLFIGVMGRMGAALGGAAGVVGHGANFQFASRRPDVFIAFRAGWVDPPACPRLPGAAPAAWGRPLAIFPRLPAPTERQTCLLPVPRKIPWAGRWRTFLGYCGGGRVHGLWAGAASVWWVFMAGGFRGFIPLCGRGPCFVCPRPPRVFAGVAAACMAPGEMCLLARRRQNSFWTCISFWAWCCVLKFK